MACKWPCVDLLIKIVVYYVYGFVFYSEFKILYKWKKKEELNNRIKRSIIKSGDATVLAVIGCLIKEILLLRQTFLYIVTIHTRKSFRA